MTRMPSSQIAQMLNSLMIQKFNSQKVQMMSCQMIQTLPWPMTQMPQCQMCRTLQVHLLGKIPLMHIYGQNMFQHRYLQTL